LRGEDKNWVDMLGVGESAGCECLEEFWLGKTKMNSP